MISEKGMTSIAAVFGAITAILLISLAVAISPLWYVGLAVGLGVCGLFGGIIFFGLRQHRVRKTITKPGLDLNLPESPSLEISVKESPYNLKSKNRSYLYLGITSIAISIFFSFDNPRLESGLALVIAITLGLTFLIWWVVSRPYVKARDLLAKTGSPRKLVLDEEGLSIPLEITTNNVFHLMLRKNLLDIRVPWADIEAWEVYSAAGRSADQHLLRVRGESKNFTGLMPVIGIVRTPELKSFDQAIIERASKQLGAGVKICTDEVKLE